MNRLRRLVLQAIATTALAWRIPAIAAWNADAFNAKTVEGALAALGIADITESSDIILKVDDIATDGAVVPVGVTSTIAGTDMIAVIIDKNPQPLALVLSLTESVIPQFSARFKMAETSNVRVVVRATGRFYQTTRKVGVTIGGCGDGSVDDTEITGTKIRATVRDKTTDVRMLIGHPMESGQRHDANGRLIPAHFIQDLTLRINDALILDAQFGRSVSRNPVLGLKMSGVQVGDEVSVYWRDNESNERNDKTRAVS